jgi:catechol 2,3-dioxygenase-like lactoylglutathione lyase family enzyme
MQVTGTHHIALFTNDLARLRDFYVNTLGLPQVGAFPGGRVIFIDAGSTTIEMIARDGWTDSDAGNWQHLALEVASTDEAHAELVGKGVAFHVEPKNAPNEENPACRIAFFRDPDGNNLELFQPIGSRYPQG